jgi:hypothetical protein
VVADLDDHRDAFGIAGFGHGSFVSRGAELLGISGTDDENLDSVRAVRVNLELGLRHRNEFGFRPGGLAHDGGVLSRDLPAQIDASTSICRGGRRLDVTSYLAARAGFNPTMAGNEPVGN